MHLLVPFASPLSQAGRQALNALVLPNLSALLALLCESARDDADEMTLSPPHERALARAAGITGPDGASPLAASTDSVAASAVALGLMAKPGIPWKRRAKKTAMVAAQTVAKIVGRRIPCGLGMPAAEI